MRIYGKNRLLLVCGFVLAATVLSVTQVDATNRVRGTGSYGTLSDHQGTAPLITGSGSGILSDTLYHCQYGGTPCPVDLTNGDPNLDLANSVSNSCLSLGTAEDSGGNALSGPAPCYDLFITINSGTTFTPGSTLSISLTGFADSGDQFGLFTCGSGLQGFDGVCTPTTNAAVSGCETALAALTAVGSTVNIPKACLAAGISFYFDETANNPVSASYVPGTVTASEPNSFVLIGVGLASLLLLSKRPRA